MCWSFSRDHGLPFSKVWAYINPYVGVPVNAVWFMVTFAFLLGLPMLQSAVAFSAVVSISTIGLYISYAIPIFLRITTARKDFVKGDFHLGFMSYPIAIIAILWIAFVTVSPAQLVSTRCQHPESNPNVVVSKSSLQKRYLYVQYTILYPQTAAEMQLCLTVTSGVTLVVFAVASSVPGFILGFCFVTTCGACMMLSV